MPRLLTNTMFVTLAAVSLLQTVRGDDAGPPPAIEGHGRVTRFPEASEQPRDGTRIVVDMILGGDRAEINASLEKVARFVNIYASAGQSPARVNLAVVLHGEATQIALDDRSYAAAFGTERNPNLPLIQELRRHNVEFLVCGQSLTLKGFRPEQVADGVRLAVSGLTALANRQQDGYVYVPILK